MALADKFVNEMKMIDIIFILVTSWIVISTLQRALDNMFYNTIGLNKDSTFHTTIIALVVIVLLLLFIYTFDDITGGLIETRLDNKYVPPS